MEPPAEIAADSTPETEEQRLNEVADRIRLAYKGVRVKISGIPNSRKVSDQQKARAAGLFDADARTVSMSSLLWDCREEAVKELRAALSGASRLFHDPRLTLPTTHDGLRMIKRDAIAEFHAKLLETRELIRRKAAALGRVLPEIVDRERIRRGDLFKAEDYQFDPESVVDLTWSFPSITEDKELAQIDDSVYQDELRRVREDLRQAAQVAEQEMAEELYNMLSTITLKLESNPDGQPKKFQNKTISRVFDELNEMSERLKTTGLGGGALGDLAQRLRTSLGGETGETLPDNVRNSATYREHVREKLDGIAKQLLTQAVPVRRRNLLVRQAAERRQRENA
jgi:hypothetical protein